MSGPFDKQKRPKVGIGVIVTDKNHPGCVLIGKRKGTAPGEGQYAVPGGHLEFGESWDECALREVREETGLVLTNVQYCTVVNGVEVDKDYHYITVFMKGEIDSGYDQQPENLEPDKCEVANGVDLPNDYHYLELYMTGEVDVSFKSEPENTEPEKCEGWFWMPWDDLPPLAELFFPLRLLKEQGYKPSLP